MKTIVTEIPDYMTFLKGQRTLEIGYPWLTFGSIMALEKILDDSKGEMYVLELGSGGSTLFFEKRAKRVISLENDPYWASMVEEKLSSLGTVTLVRNNRISKLLSFIKEFPDECFDLILVDSWSGGAAYKHRQEMLEASATKVKNGGWLVIDNYEHLKFDYSGYDVYTFDMFRYSGRGTKLCRRI